MHCLGCNDEQGPKDAPEPEMFFEASLLLPVIYAITVRLVDCCVIEVV